MHRHILILAVLNANTLIQGVYSWWQIPILEYRVSTSASVLKNLNNINGSQPAANVDLFPRIRISEELSTHRCSLVPYTELSRVGQKGNVEALLVLNDPRTLPRADVLLFYRYRHCGTGVDPFIVVKLNSMQGLQVIDFKGLGIKTRAMVIKGYRIWDPEVKPYLRDAPDARTGVWYFDNPIGKFFWVDAHVNLIKDPFTKAVMDEGYSSEWGPMTEAMQMDYEEYRRNNPNPPRIDPVIDPLSGDKRLPHRFEDMVEGFKDAASAGRQDSWIEHYRKLYNMANFISQNIATSMGSNPVEGYKAFLEAPKDAQAIGDSMSQNQFEDIDAFSVKGEAGDEGETFVVKEEGEGEAGGERGVEDVIEVVDEGMEEEVEEGPHESDMEDPYDTLDANESNHNITDLAPVAVLGFLDEIVLHERVSLRDWRASAGFNAVDVADELETKVKPSGRPRGVQSYRGAHNQGQRKVGSTRASVAPRPRGRGRGRGRGQGRNRGRGRGRRLGVISNTRENDNDPDADSYEPAVGKRNKRGP
ncbi:hypothetical protein TWF730_005846 [Orbilia blumenaviensis]|uniref:Uncharacterized protein n=1 Tax=Orbilia blumenaviensis TaxID=1796055 RepID=A0AAV9VJT2_9PEZI